MWFEIELQNYRCFSESHPAKFHIMPGVSAFVGPNNSGKTALLRFFYEARPLFQSLSGTSVFVDTLTGKPKEVSFRNISDPDEILSNFGKGDLRIIFRVHEPAPIRGDCMIPDGIAIVFSRESFRWTTELIFGGETISHAGKVDARGPRLYVEATGLANELELTSFIKLWSELANAMYVGPVRHVIHPGNTNYDVSNGHEVINAWRKLKVEGNFRDRNLALALESQLAQMFQFRTLEINPDPSGNELVICIDKKAYYLRGLGSGFSQVLVLLVNLAVKRPSFLFIDEPELNLHPGLQIEFVRALHCRTERGLLFATHNIGLARETAQTIYTVIKAPGQPSSVSAQVPGVRLSELMGEMSFSALRELGLDRVLLVEGPTEVKVVQALLKVAGVEARKILLVPLGGASMINGSRRDELQELIRIVDDPSMVFAIIDSERESSHSDPKQEHVAFAEVCKELKITCHMLKRRAIENYFTDRAITDAFGNGYQSLGEFGLLRDANPRWNKRDNWRIAEVMQFDELSSTDLGHFLLLVSGRTKDAIPSC